ncbi:MAG: rhodanese-like domain-containing protein [Thermodesulfobacteriota bacterium]
MRTISLMCLLLLTTATSAVAGSYNYVGKKEFKGWLTAGKSMVIVDIQEKDAFAKHHFPGSIETNAFPVKTDAQRRSIDPAVVKAKANMADDVIVVCPRGGGGAKRCYDYLRQQGVADSRLYILKGGVDKWPHRAMLEKESGS